MPTTMLTLAWLLVATINLAAPASATVTIAPPPVSIVSTAAYFSQAPPSIVGTSTDGEQDQNNWFLFESENDEETDDSEEFGISAPTGIWPEPLSPFGSIGSNPHPTILPKSALRSPVLRC